jgi:methionine-rich copper-binding protein CopC
MTPAAPSADDRPLRATPRASTAAAALLAAALASGCHSSPRSMTSHVAVNPPGAGVVFSYPADRQQDVPLGARVLLSFSRDLPAAVDTGCSSTAGQVTTGSFCVEGPDGFVAGAVAVEGSTLAFTPAAPLAAGATYRVWARPDLLPGGNNLPPQVPLFTFRARTTRILAGQAASVLTVNGEPLAADGSIAVPVLDAAPVRLLFSEPLDPATVSTGVRLVHVADGAEVEGVALVDGIHLTFQPAANLAAGDAYRLELAASVHDLGGEPIAPASLAFTPRRTAVPGHGLYPLNLAVAPAWSDVATQPRSRLGAMPVNANALSSQLAGANTLGVLAGGLDVLAGDPQAMGTPLPMLIPRGQRLDLTSMAIRYGGVLDAGLQTGTLHFTMLADALGYLIRNPYRGDTQEPDDVESPTWVDFTMDALISSEDAHGNVLATQTVMGVRVLGLSTLDGDQLAIEQVGAIDFALLGVETAPVSLALRFRTGTSSSAGPALGTPVLVASYPADGAADVSPAEPVALDFSGPLDPARLRPGVEVTLARGAAAIPASARMEGATLVLVPARRLDEGASYTLRWSGLRALDGAAVTDGSLSFTTASTSSTRTTAPIITALVPGAPCALTGASAGSPGHCAGGQTSDSGYQPFTLPANRDVRVLFSQPVDPASLTLGAACGRGSVRVEQVGANGRCAAVVAGTLVKRDREVRFVPSAPWAPGAAYRLTLVAGTGGTCASGDICGRNARPLNTNPLAGAAANDGGPDVVVDFTGAPATADVYQPLRSDPIADQNGDGYLDSTEHPNDRNRVAMEIAGHDGIVTSASLAGADCLADRPGQQACSYLDATLPVSIGGVLPACPVDGAGNPSSAANPCIEVRVYPNEILGTSTFMNTTAMGLIPFTNLPTGMLVMRLRELGAPIHGYIMREAGSADPVFVINQDVYFDAPDLSIPLASHDLQSKPLHVTLKGPVTFRSDGRMDVALRSTGDVTIRVNVSALFMPGGIDLLVPAGEMRITLAGPPLR